MNTTLRTLCTRLCLAASTITALEATASAAPVDVYVTIDRMKAVLTTERSGGNTRDEVYVAIAGRLPWGVNYIDRLPTPDDYYGLHSGESTQTVGWTNQDGAPVGAPVIWAGKLDHGQVAAFTVHLGEQDNKDVDVIKSISLAIVGRLAGFIPLPFVGSVLSNLADAAQSIPVDATDDMLGTFIVTIRNDNGAISTMWDPLSTTTPKTTTIKMAGDNASASFTSFGTDGAWYEYSAKVVKGQAPPVYLGQEFDACGETNLDVRNASGQLVRVAKGQRRTMPIALDGSGEFTWYCGGTREVTEPSWRDANVVEVVRAASGRGITWNLFRRR